MKAPLDLDNRRAIFTFVAELHSVVDELDAVVADASRPTGRRRLIRAQARDRQQRARAALAWLADAVSHVGIRLAPKARTSGDHAEGGAK
jgi:hypothetical protein